MDGKEEEAAAQAVLIWLVGWLLQFLFGWLVWLVGLFGWFGWLVWLVGLVGCCL